MGATIAGRAGFAVSRYFLGVDGGQSSTTALIADQSGRVLGIGRAGPCNHAAASEGREKFITVLAECLKDACRSAGLEPVPQFESACLGFSGGPADKEDIIKEILTCQRIAVTHDALVALSGAMAGAAGIIVIAGTGSIAFGRNAAGRCARAGGWGYLFGDEGSGFDIVRQAMRASLQLEEGWGRATSLRALLLEASGARDANDLLHRFYTPEFPRPRIAAMAKLVDEAAIEGDTVAREILVGAGQALAKLAAAVRPQLFEAGEQVRISYSGGVYRSPVVRARFFDVVASDSANHVEAPVYGPAAGALLEAYRAAGLSCALADVPEEKP